MYNLGRKLRFGVPHVYNGKKGTIVFGARPKTNLTKLFIVHWACHGKLAPEPLSIDP